MESACRFCGTEAASRNTTGLRIPACSARPPVSQLTILPRAAGECWLLCRDYMFRWPSDLLPGSPCPQQLGGRPGLSCMGAAGAENSTRREFAPASKLPVRFHIAGLRGRSPHMQETRKMCPAYFGVASSGALCTRGHASDLTSNNVFPAELV